ncbi:hypothetical protein Dimus_034852 [Dionaea muscipula]
MAFDDSTTQGAPSSADEITDDFDSAYMISEPPDIRNWFPDYVYESPVLDSNDIGVSLSRGGTQRCSSSSTEAAVAVLVQEQEKDEKVKDDDSAIAEEIISCAGLEVNLVKVVRLQEDQGFIQGPPIPFSSNENFVTELRSRKKLRKVEESMEEEEEESYNPISMRVKRGFSLMAAEKDHDLVSIKEEINNNENSVEQQKPFKSQNEVKDTSMRTTRKALDELTNHGNATDSENAGKWRCPQKSKANVGPPLKQLRLELWVRRL